MAASPSRDTADASPNSSSFLSSTSHQVAAGSVRRNLFSAHLSRRPASGAQSQSQSQSQSNSNQTRRQEPSQSQTQRQQQYGGGGSSLPRPRGHQRSASTPSLSPSPPRSSPFHDAPPNNNNGARSSAFAPPPMPQLSPPHRAAPPLVDGGYDPTTSPHRPLSPRSSAALFPNQSIVALNPLTGRPVLPKIPVLPGRLRLTDSDDGHGEEHGEEDWSDDDDDEEGDEEDANIEPGDAHEHAFSDDGFHSASVQPHSRRTGRRGAQQQGHDAYGHHSSHIQRVDHGHAAAMDAGAEAEADEERRDRQRIERLLREMMARQRARAKGKASASASAAVDDDDEAAEKDELMGLIMGSLRREVAKAEEEAWMFGEALGIGGMAGRDEVGVYD
ncbi:uncharacterized protein Z520_09959 [Fonsecaea multimorphosa CBS 102226]|uniref:Uncharacterized protein n=1 Tax=Fonsecaea multimorphosa CBS 102226 TaxID=1442371 RepID=A0A0D2JUQ2_9EURO|nr:uncharacterized protein Z520_09959 [Fonsecaea multimorphosa CBS 102226]KIX94249.1 hypothetical protein Z520_09959 [Fonsecaea multimorphosa CBS 102226]OAL19931.1 hypothetical protein AYO22_09458 [Fonsecaea multimorphosa]